MLKEEMTKYNFYWKNPSFSNDSIALFLRGELVCPLLPNFSAKYISLCLAGFYAGIKRKMHSEFF
jgi:hypothetical protein